MTDLRDDPPGSAGVGLGQPVVPERDSPAPALEEALGYRFADRALLETALTHSSYAHEQRDCASNERLEFLGDSVIGLVGASLLYDAHPDWPEGDLTRALHQLVDGPGLASLARAFDVGPHLRLGRTERQSAGDEKESILADAMEALLGAMYIDAGLKPVKTLARRVFAKALLASAPRVELDPKTRFQEWVVAEFGSFPRYRLVSDSEVEGDDERFTIEVVVEGRGWARGCSRSKQRAEREAAANAHEQREALARQAADDLDLVEATAPEDEGLGGRGEDE